LSFNLEEPPIIYYGEYVSDDGTYRHHFMISSKFLVKDNGIVRSDLKREEFLDLMFKNYPEYAEWLLFHMEWLR